MQLSGSKTLLWSEIQRFSASNMQLFFLPGSKTLFWSEIQRFSASNMQLSGSKRLLWSEIQRFSASNMQLSGSKTLLWSEIQRFSASNMQLFFFFSLDRRRCFGAKFSDFQPRTCSCFSLWRRGCWSEIDFFFGRYGPRRLRLQLSVPTKLIETNKHKETAVKQRSELLNYLLQHADFVSRLSCLLDPV